MFKGFELVSISNLNKPLTAISAGDSVRVTAQQSQVGDMLYEAAYTWKVDYKNGITGNERTLGTQTVKIVYDADKSDPFIRFRTPDTIGEINVTFTAEYQFSSATYTEINGEAGGSSVTSSSLMARASGKKRYQVK